VMAGDDDLLTLAHTTSLYESLPQGQLAVIPGASHAVVLEKPELVGRFIGDFLSAPGVPETYLPIRRKSPK
jgi:pimeloyl-ACP methyl ester carboxylesterase